MCRLRPIYSSFAICSRQFSRWHNNIYVNTVYILPWRFSYTLVSGYHQTHFPSNSDIFCVERWVSVYIILFRVYDSLLPWPIGFLWWRKSWKRTENFSLFSLFLFLRGMIVNVRYNNPPHQKKKKFFSGAAHLTKSRWRNGREFNLSARYIYAPKS